MNPCPECTSYTTRRGDRIRAEIAKTVPWGPEIERRFRLFLEGVHARHLAGKTIEP